MAKQSSLSNEDRENLSAYLDGELDEKTARALEAKLNADPRARAEAEALSRTWQLLDYLPQPQPSTAFTSRTLESVSALRPVQPAPAAPGRQLPWAFGLGWAAAVLVAALAGFAGVTYLAPSPHPAAPTSEAEPANVDELLAQDLRILENLHLYQHVDDLGFLHKLDDPDLFGDDK
jgi:anti-sigma factor RsiW